MQNFVLASSNSGKLREIQAALADSAISLLPQTTFSIPDAEETGLTFVENAILKARQAAQISGLPAIADDSGLAVAALDGKPGIYSARYAGAGANADKNITKLLHEMASIPADKRQAYFYCVIVLLRNPYDPAPIICQGQWQGSILFSTQGDQGFGYDPIFYVPTHNCSAAQLDIAEKNRISHRGQALAMLKGALMLNLPPL